MPRAGTPDDIRGLFEAILDALNARDFDALPELFEPDQEFHSLLAAAEGLVFVGVEGIRRFMDEVDATWDGFRIELIDFREVGADQAVAVTRNVGTARVSGVPLDQCRGMVLTRRNGRAWRNVVYPEVREAYRAAGLRE